MTARIGISVLIVMTLIGTNANAATVYEEDGNIYYEDNGVSERLSSSGRDENPALHPGGEWVFFVRGTEGEWDGERYHPARGEIIENGILKEGLWRVRADGSDAERLFINDRGAVDGPDPDYVIATVGNIQFSPEGDKVYFETPNWVTSAALHVMNPDGSDEKLLGPGNETKIVISARELNQKHGACKGYIVTNQHRYWWFGGSYDWWFLYTSDFEEVGPLGDDFDYFTEIGDIVYTDHSEKNIGKSEKLKGLID